MDISFDGFRKQLRKWKSKFKKEETDSVYKSFTPSRGKPTTVLAKNTRYTIPETIKDVLAPDEVGQIFMNIFEINIVHYGYCRSFNEDPEKAWEVLKELYDKILKKDPFWHFFYEGAFSIIRCSGELTEEVCEFLDEHDIVYTEPEMWFDSSATVRNYHNVFTVLFHSFSVLAMEYDNSEWFYVADRVIHCYMNHQWYRQWAQWFQKCWGEDYWEGMAISEHGLRRGGYQNWVRGLQEGEAKADKRWKEWAEEEVL